jgi:flagellin-like hook-associated protein FlgL
LISRNSPMLASLRDADSVANLHPVVSLRSTTGYRISSLRDDPATSLPFTV